MRKAQGEIFGIALLFVIIILAIVLFSKLDLLENDQDKSIEQRYQILAQSSLNMILQTSTGCEIERNQDALIDLILYCVAHSSYATSISCSHGQENVCDYSKELLNESLVTYFQNKTQYSFAPILYKLDIWSPSALQNQEFSELNFTNSCSEQQFLSDASLCYSYRNSPFEIGERNQAPLSFSKVSSGIFSYQSFNRDLNFELFLFYR